MKPRPFLLVLVLPILLAVGGCDTTSAPDDAGEPAVAADAGTEDAGIADAGTEGTEDAGNTDAGNEGTEDAGNADAGTEDAGTEDNQDAGTEDAGTQANVPECPAIAVTAETTSGDTRDGFDENHGSCADDPRFPELVYHYSVQGQNVQVHVEVEDGLDDSGVDRFTTYARRSCTDPTTELACSHVPGGINPLDPDRGKSFILTDLTQGEDIYIFVDGHIFVEDNGDRIESGGLFNLHIREVQNLVEGDVCDFDNADALCAPGLVCGAEQTCEVDPCFGIPPEGACEGDTVAFCAGDSVVRYDCADESEGGTCEVSPVFGAACHVPVGAVCGYPDFASVPCAAGGSCVYEQPQDITATCAPAVTPAGECVPGTCTADNEYVLSCFGVVKALSCPGGCETDKGCIGAAEGAFCNANTACDTGLLCVDQVCVPDDGESLSDIAPSCNVDLDCASNETCFESFCHAACEVNTTCTTVSGAEGTCVALAEGSTDGACQEHVNVFEACGGEHNADCALGQGFCFGVGQSAYCLSPCYTGLPCPGGLSCGPNDSFCSTQELDGDCGPATDGQTVSMCSGGQRCSVEGTCQTF